MTALTLVDIGKKTLIIGQVVKKETIALKKITLTLAKKVRMPPLDKDFSS